MKIKLNLTSPEKKEEIRKKDFLKFVIRVEIVITIGLIVFLVTLSSFLYILNLNLSVASESQKESADADKYLKIEKYDDQFNRINTEVSDIVGIKKDQLYWSRIMLKINNLVFPGIILNSFLSDNYAVIIKGISDSRENLILFKENLEKDGCFFDVNLPLGDLVQKNNIEFQINFSIKSECLKNK